MNNSTQETADRKLVVAIRELNAAQREQIREAAAAAGLSAAFYESPQEALPAAREAEVIFADGTALAGAAPALRWMCTPYAGVEPYTAPGVFASPLAVLTNSSGAYGTTIAEHVIQVSLMMLRQGEAYRQHVEKQEWVRGLPIRSLKDSRILLLGTGDIGRECAKRLRAFGPASLTGLNRSGRHPGGEFDRVLPLAELDGFLPETDLLIISLPGTPETYRLMRAELLKKLPDHALIVNVGRGSIIDQAALEQELRAGRLSAALDVFETEPIPEGASLWDCPRLLITPHIAGNLSLPYTVQRITELFWKTWNATARASPSCGRLI